MTKDTIQIEKMWQQIQFRYKRDDKRHNPDRKDVTTDSV